MRDVFYPFAAIVGQEKVKKALLLNLIDPTIGGVLLCGQKGTAKSTIARALGGLCDKKLVDLPLNATEDMLVGGVDFVRTVEDGERRFSAGLLERANGNILYVDEINLLADSMAAAVVCAAAAGENIVEREGISFRHECRFILIGSMNPEEGGLRPQLLDKFGLYVNVEGEEDVQKRAEIIRRRLAYERDPAAFRQSYRAQSEELAAKVKKARERLHIIKIDESIRKIAAKFAQNARSEGNRCELLLIKTATAAAAFDGRRNVSISDIKEAAQFVLPHRRREAEPPRNNGNPKEPDENEPQDNRNNEASGKNQNAPPAPGKEDERRARDNGEEPQGGEDEIDAQYDDEPPRGDTDANAPEDLVEGEEIYETVALSMGVRDRTARKGTGRRQKTNSSVNKGRYAGFSVSKGNGQFDIALDATLRAAAPYQKGREKNGCAVTITDADLRYKKRESHIGATIVFVVDASGSMGAAKRMKETKEAVLSMLMDSYQKRDKIGLIAFCGQGAEVLLNITSSIDLAQKELQQLPTGGRTPLADGLYSAWQLLAARRRKDPEMLPLVVLVSDGRANGALWSDDPVEDALKAAMLIAGERIPAVVVDTENDFLSFHLAQRIASAMDATYFKVGELRSTQLRGLVSLKQHEWTGFTGETAV